MVDLKESEHGPAQTEPAPDQFATLEEVDALAADKSNKFAAFQFYPRDFLADDKVARMSNTEIGIYVTLLCYSWLSRGLSPEPEQLARLARTPLARFKKLWAGTLSECFVMKAGRFVNPRQERQRKELEAYVASCQKGGERSAEARRERYGTSQPLRSGPRSDLRSEKEVTPNTSSASSSSSASAEKTIERRTTLIPRRRGDAAWEGARVYVPQRKHSDFVALRNHAGAEAELFAWYAEVDDDWARGARQSHSADPDMLRFWTARYAEKWPPAATKVDTRPQWLQDAEARKRAAGAQS